MSATEPIAYQNGHWIPSATASVPLYDAGFVLGVTVSEQLRTFGGTLFRLAEHLDRLERSLALIRGRLPISRAELSNVAQHVIAHNYPLAPAGSDLGLAILVSPGPYGSFSSGATAGPSLWVQSYLLPMANWCAAYREGVHLVIADTRQVPEQCWPAALKCRSRMHYYLADREVAERYPGAKSLLLNVDGFVTETSVANLLMVDSAGTLISPPREHILPGITLQFIQELAAQLGLHCEERPLRPEDLHSATELLLTSTPTVLQPVTRLDERTMGTGKPGIVYRQLLAACNAAIGVDIAVQAHAVANQ